MQATAELLKALAAFVSAVAWPAIALVALFKFHEPVGRLIDRIKSFKGAGIEVQAEVQQALAKSGQEAEASGSREATPAERARAERVEELAKQTSLDFIRQQAEQLAAEYERVRASMLPGDRRTRAMEVVVAKMRTIGRAAFPLRHEFARSASPGRRLQAIAILQLEPDYDLLGWLAERPATEKPFVAYHAVVALRAAAEDARAPVHAAVLRLAMEQARANIAAARPDADRDRVFQRFAASVAGLPAASAAPA
jgi:hypothetical protein